MLLPYFSLAGNGRVYFTKTKGELSALALILVFIVQSSVII